jgi:uncharacterized membrane protein YfcA
MLIPLCLGTLIGARIGATLNGKLNSPFLKVSFGALFVCVAFKYLMMFGGP